MSDDIENKNMTEEEMLNEVDSFLVEKDPEFVKGLAEVKINNADIQFSVMEQALDVHAIPNDEPSFFSKERLIQLVDIRNNAKKVILFWFSVLTVVVVVYFVVQTRFWDHRSSLFMTSFAELNSSVKDYNPFNDVQFFFDNPRLSKNIITLKKMYVNLKPSAGSGENPMLAFEITVEGLSREVVVELKDREAEFIDKASRITEEFSYDELTGIEGKQKLSGKLVSTFNASLTSGQIRKVMYSTFILKD